MLFARCIKNQPGRNIQINDCQIQTQIDIEVSGKTVTVDHDRTEGLDRHQWFGVLANVGAYAHINAGKQSKASSINFQEEDTLHLGQRCAGSFDGERAHHLDTNLKLSKIEEYGRIGVASID